MATGASKRDPALTGALACARLGLRVFPVWGVVPLRDAAVSFVCQCPKGADCEDSGKHPIPKRWQQMATTEPRQIEHWAALNRGCNFGVRGDDLIVVDIDPRNGGALEDVPPWLPDTAYRVTTGGGGWHLGYRVNGTPVRGGKLQAGIDLKGRGGYVVAPGSMHVSGQRYAWEQGRPPTNVAAVSPWPTDAPPVASVTRGEGPGPSGRSRLVDLLESPPGAGERNVWLTAVAGHYATALPFRDAFEHHVRAANLLLPDPLGEDEVARTIESIWTAETAKAEGDSQPSPRPAHGPPLPVLRPAMTALSVTELQAMADADGKAQFLVEPLWPGDAYGVLGAEDKAGKTWAAVDLAISVATGGAWFGHFACRSPGTVLTYVGEGGARSTLRRLRAVAAWRDLTLDDLQGVITVLAAPRLGGRGNDLGAIADHLDVHRPRCVIIDPLYLAMVGVKGSDLYAMGELLSSVQELTQQAGAALVVITHWNKTGTGTGPERFTGVGPGAWGRVLGSAEVKNRRTAADGGSSVLLGWQFRGGEIEDSRFTTWRHVRAEDPTDLASPLHYEVEVSAEDWHSSGSEGTTLTANQQRVLNALGAEPEPGQTRIDQEWLTVRDIGDRVASDKAGPPLKGRTIQAALTALEEVGLTEPDTQKVGMMRRWRRTG